MRNTVLLGFVLLAILLPGCAHQIPLTYQESCASRGMVFSGIETYNGQAFAYGANGAWANVQATGESVSCSVPKTQVESCQTEYLANESAPKRAYNSNVQSLRLLTGIGYVLYIVPGVAMKYVADKRYDKAVLDSQDYVATTPNSCSALEPREPASKAP